MSKANAFDPTTYVFKSVLTRTLEGFSQTLRQELVNLPEDLFKKFRIFPRTYVDYSSIIITLSNIASVNVPSVLEFLDVTFIEILQNPKKRLPFNLEILAEYDEHNQTHRAFVRVFQIMFLTDLISTIVSKYEEISSEYKNLLKLGFALASISVDQPLMYEFILPYYATVISNISKRNFNLFYNAFSQLIINKPEPYFVILMYCALDMSEESIEFVGCLFDYMNREKRKKSLTNKLFSSVATILVSYKQDINEQTIKDIVKFSEQCRKCQNTPVESGCLEVLSVIKAKNHENVSELKQFFVDNIVPIINNEENFEAAMRCYYFLVFSNYIESENMFRSWIPKTNETEGFFPTITLRDEEKDSAEIKEMGDIFVEYLDRDDYSEKCQIVLRNILLHFAQLDLQFFMDRIAKSFFTTEMEDKFTTFLSCVSAINSDGFIQDKSVLNDFNSRLSTITFQKLRKVLNNVKDLRFFSNKLIESEERTTNANNYITDLFKKWSISPGPMANVMSKSTSIPFNEKVYIPWHHLVEILPFVLKSSFRSPNAWTETLVRLSAVNNSSISKPAMMILEHNLDDIDERAEICSNILEMITLEQNPEVVFVCLTLLLHAAKSREPLSENSRNPIIEKIESISFLCLCSEHPLVRRTAYNLLMTVNKILKNGGLYSHIEPHIQAIESNVKHNILLRHLSKKPEQHEFFGEEILIDQAIDSPYTYIWFFFLAEISRVVEYVQYEPVISAMTEYLDQFISPRVSHLHQGLLTVFLSIFTDKTYVNRKIFLYETLNSTVPPPNSQNYAPQLQQLTKIIELCTSKERSQVYFDILIFTNYTLMPLVISKLRSVAESVRPDRTIDFSMKMDIFYMMLKTIEFIPNIMHRVKNDLLIILEKAEQIYGTTYTSSTRYDQILFYLLCRTIWLHSNTKELFDAPKRSTMLFIKKLLNFYSNSPQMISYASNTLVALFESEPGFREDSMHEKLIKSLLNTLIVCHEHNYNVLEPLLEKDFNLFIKYYIMYCFSENQRISEFFFNSIHNVILKCAVDVNDNSHINSGEYSKEASNETSNETSKENSKENIKEFLREKSKENLFDASKENSKENIKEFLREKSKDNLFDASKENSKETSIENMKMMSKENSKENLSESSKDNAKLACYVPDELILTGLYMLKTGSSSARSFLRTYMSIFIGLKKGLNQQGFEADLESDMSTFDLVYKHAVKQSGAIVLFAMDLIVNNDFNGSTKIVVDVITPFIKNFRLLPNQQAWVPKGAVFSRMSPYMFVPKLYDVTCRIKKQDFQSLVSIWYELLKVKDHISIVLPLLFESDNPEVKVDLFISLVALCTKDRDQCTMRKKLFKMLLNRLRFSYFAYCEFQNSIEYRNEMWVVPVVTKLINTKDPYIENHMQIIIHYALLFHSSYSQSMLKKVCKHYGITYTRRTLSNESLRYLVQRFSNALKRRNDGETFVNKWALEAMRWVIGSRSMRIASTSLVILNSLEFTAHGEDIVDFSYGICKTVAHFLGTCTENNQQTNSFINETLKFFEDHFEGHESFVFEYLSCFFNFVSNVDAYFDNMLPLYIKCSKSDITRESAKPFLLSAICPIFNELETDKKAMDTFTSFKESNPKLVDLTYVSTVLSPLDDNSLKSITELIECSSVEEINNALNHYSLMVMTASTDLMKRIFRVTTLLLQKYREIRMKLQHSLRKKMSQSEIPPIVLSSLTVDNRKAELPERKTDEKSDNTPSKKTCDRCKNGSDSSLLRIDLNTHALHGLYKAALKIVVQESEAVDFICELSKVDPLITTTSPVDEKQFQKEAQKVITKLSEISQADNIIVTLTKCKSLKSVSNLHSRGSNLQIQPFTTEHQTVESFSPEPTENVRPEKRFHMMLKEIVENFAILRENVKSKLSPNVAANIERHFTSIKLPTQILHDEIEEVKQINPLYDLDSFTKLSSGKVKTSLSRHSSVRIDQN